MNNSNSILVEGNLVSDPELSHTSSVTAIVHVHRGMQPVLEAGAVDESEGEAAPARAHLSGARGVQAADQEGRETYRGRRGEDGREGGSGARRSLRSQAGWAGALDAEPCRHLRPSQRARTANVQPASRELRRRG